MKIVKTKEFKDHYDGVYKDSNFKDLEQWQKENPSIKILDTKINQKVYTSYENYLVVTYEEEVADHER